MEEGFVHKTIQRSNLGSLMLSAFGLIVILILALLLSRYFYNFFKGPFPVAQNDLIARINPEDQLEYYVSVQGETALDTGYQYVSTDDSGRETVENYYYALPVQDRLLLVRTSKPDLVDAYSGWLISMPKTEQEKVISALEGEVPQLKGLFLPVLLDVNEFKLPGYLGIGGAVIVLILCALLFITVLRRSMDPLSHPIMRMLSTYSDPDMTAMQLDSEIASAGPKLAGAYITQNWLVAPTPFTLKAMHITDIVWLYKQVVTHRTYGIAVSKSYTATIVDRNGKTIKVSAKEAKVDELLSALHARAPYAVSGYDSRIDAVWRKNRQDLISEVDRRKRTI